MEAVKQRQEGGDHYVKLSVQPWDAMRSWFPDSFNDYLLMNALKYIARNKTDKREDIAKAIHYLEQWMEATSQPLPCASQTNETLLDQEYRLVSEELDPCQLQERFLDNHSQPSLQTAKLARQWRHTQEP